MHKKFEPFDLIDKTGRNITIRAAVPEDALGLLEHARRIFTENNYLLRGKDEFLMDEAGERAWIQSHIDCPEALLLVADDGGRITGNLNMEPYALRRLRHMALLGMSLAEGYKGAGIGYALLRAAVDWARNRSGLQRLLLQVAANNSAGIALYLKCGFVQEGCQPRYLRLDDGSYLDSWWMGLDL